MTTKKLTKTLLNTLIIGTLLTACSKNETSKPAETDVASVAEAQAVPMSAMPADTNNAPAIISDNNTNNDIANDTASTTNDTDIPAETEGGEDNSAMENISEDAEIIDDEPASPNAPQVGETNDNVNQKVN